ncbi:MAG TPA: ribonuclease H-like domain-containing protein [Vicinamibacterales bacterium]|nr:ribonuclease H-like domain-containing protein [Vicinamibacterales bacterium]
MSALSDRIRSIVKPDVVRSDVAQPFRAAGEAGVKGCATIAADISAVLGGARNDDCFVVERRYAPNTKHGRATVGAIAAQIDDASAHASWFAGGAPAHSPFVFFDLETTGLSGGAGTLAFLVGCATFDDDGSFVVRQFLLTAHQEEPAMLRRVAAMLAGAGALVSFNGKSFDAPVLETRYAFHRLAWPGAKLPHVDVLHPSRRFWNLDDSSLVSLERAIIGARRVGDVPGFEIPSRYFQFLRSGNARPLVEVLEHNRLDLLTLAALTARLLWLARSGPDAAATAREALALGHVFARAGMDVQARAAFERSLALCAAPPGAYDATRIEALRSLAQALRRARDFEIAARCWSQLLDTRGCPATVAREASEALAVHHEHRVRDLEAARAFALRGLTIEDVAPAPPPASWTRTVRHRLARIERKMLNPERTRAVTSASPSLLS